MRVIVCGGRFFNDLRRLESMLDSIFSEREVTIITGGAPGADRMANQWARSRGHKAEVYRADWNRYGNAAGPIRNKEMLDTGVDMVIAFPGDRGTANMVKIAREAGVLVFNVAPRPSPSDECPSESGSLGPAPHP